MNDLIKDTRQQLASVQTQRQEQADDVQSLKAIFDQNKKSLATTKAKFRALKEMLEEVTVSTNSLLNTYLVDESSISYSKSVSQVHSRSPHLN